MNPVSNNKNQPFYYAVYAYDQDTTGAVRQGGVSYRDVNDGDKAPSRPGSLAASASGGNATVTWTIPSDPDDFVESFRVYRRAAGTPLSTAWDVPNRLTPDGYDSATAFCANQTAVGSTCSFTDTNTGGVAHQYMVTAVDSKLRESLYITTTPPSA
jgi:hypothetical protein